MLTFRPFKVNSYFKLWVNWSSKNSYTQIFRLCILNLFTRIPKLPDDDIWLPANLYICDPNTDRQTDARAQLLPTDKKREKIRLSLAQLICMWVCRCVPKNNCRPRALTTHIYPLLRHPQCYLHSCTCIFELHFHLLCFLPVNCNFVFFRIRFLF